MGYLNIRNTLAIATLLLLGFGLQPQNARAVEEGLRLLEKPIARFLLTETQEGTQLLERLTGQTSREASLRIFSERMGTQEYSTIRTELENRLSRIQRALEEYRTLKGKGENAESIAADEKIVLREVAARELRVADSARWKVGDPAVEEPREFLARENPNAFETTKNKFLADSPMDPASDVAIEELATRAPLGEKATKSVFGRVKSFFGEMRACTKSMPPATAKKNNLRYILSQLGISEFMTVTGYVTASGSKPVDWKSLPTDMIIAGLTTVGGGFFMTKQANSFQMRWVRMVFFNEGRAAFDGVVYFLSPLKDTHGYSNFDATLRRYEYNVVWNASSPIISVSVYSLLNGLECLYPGARMASASTGIRLGVSFGTSLMYFKFRKATIGM